MSEITALVAFLALLALLIPKLRESQRPQNNQNPRTRSEAVPKRGKAEGASSNPL